MAKNIVTGLDIGTASIKVVVCEYRKGEKIPRVLALARKTTRGLRRGYVTQTSEVANCISEAVNEASKIGKVKINRVIVGLGGITLESKVTDGQTIVARADSEINEYDIDRVIESCESNLNDPNRTVIHHIPLLFKLDGKKIIGQPEGLKGAKLEAKTMFITYANQHLKELMAAVAEAELKVDDIVASPLAAGITNLTKLQKTSGSVLLNIGAQTTSAVVFEEAIPISLKIFPLGSNDITNDIALGFRIPLEEAEKIKTGQLPFDGPKKKLEEIIEARLSDIFELIENHLKKIGRSGLLPAGVIITGGGVGIYNVEEFAKNYFRLPTKTAESSMASSSRNQIKDPTWSVAYGLCLFGSDQEAEESIGVKMARQTKNTFIKWLKELLP